MQARPHRRRLRSLIKRIRWRGKQGEPDFQTAARQTLQPLVEAFFAAGSTDLTDPNNLHQMRIAGKKLRYAIESLGQACDSRLQHKIYPQFCEIQEDLGQIHDHLVAQQLFDNWLVQSEDSQTDGELARLVTQEQLALQTATECFRRAWNATTADQLRRQFDRLWQPDQHKKQRKRSAKRSKGAMTHA